MQDFQSLAHCADIADDVVASAVQSRDAMGALLARTAEIARPMEGAARVLVAFAQMASGAASWFDGDLVVEISGDEEASVFDVMTDLGGGVHERLFPTFTMNVPLDEFVRAVRLVPRMVAPLQAQQHEGRLVLTSGVQAVARATSALRGSTSRVPIVPPPKDEDDLSDAFADLGFVDAPRASEPRVPTAEPPSPPKPAAPRLMPRFDAPPKPKAAPHRPSQKPTVTRMAALRPDELEALRPSRVPAAPPTDEPSPQGPPTIVPATKPRDDVDDEGWD